jgi:hypothetical protein
MLSGNFRTSTPDVGKKSKTDKKDKKSRRLLMMPTYYSNSRESIKEEVNNSKLRMMDINPQAANNLK